MKPLALLLSLCLCLPAAAQQTPGFDCEASEKHRQFDFWVGDWAVTDKAGKILYGRNRITKRENGCMLLEEYDTGQGFSGSSINYYNPSDGKWHQQWVDNGNSIIRTSGELKKGSMVMRGKIFYLESFRTAKFRGKWTPLDDGRVRQLFEEKDSQGDWQVWFDGYYQRIPAD